MVECNLFTEQNSEPHPWSLTGVSDVSQQVAEWVSGLRIGLITARVGFETIVKKADQKLLLG